ncbi:NADH dehydrogenase (ubiquinone) 30 kDa subunit [Thermodesulfobium narugense DSM 14796]|uniref:NADH dehydrogenase (Ubiquinone) 30 kDa subunit n=1 Tax=Thermodesulfobium narugense DSM 14796 TaxID=747365 RepID=M1E852_9BACT|nr:NADH-quinone oxidoreductase subunit C [Thermodesulfobium narugense]AEE14279.1 NADH dehydrogenase (ubiquinone) 30 kDa subunit [Thermodesulfobium narugense DSM 14796]
MGKQNLSIIFEKIKNSCTLDKGVYRNTIKDQTPLEVAIMMRSINARLVLVNAFLDLQDERTIILENLYDIDGCLFSFQFKKNLPATFTSITSIYPNANWGERECFEMFGIDFSDNKDIKNGLLLTSQKDLKTPLLKQEIEKILIRKNKVQEDKIV